MDGEIIMNKSGKNIRKMIAFVLIAAVTAVMFSACAAGTDTTQTTTDSPVTQESTTEVTTETSAEVTTETTEEPAKTPESIRVAALKGPTGMGIAHMVNEYDSGNISQSYEFSFAGAPDELTAGLISGQLDIAALPTNVASVLYNKTEGEIQLLAINTLGVLYVLEAGDSVQSINDLSGKSIFATGQGAVPEFVLAKLIADNNVDAEVSFKAEHSELATLAASGQADLVMLPEPFVTTVLNKRADMRRALDLTQVWKDNQKTNGGEGDLAMGCLAVSKSFAEQYPEAVTAFLADYKKSTEFANENPAETGELVAKYEIMAAAGLAAAAIPNCYITMIAGDDMKSVLEPLLETLFAANPQSVGGKLPGDDFYYVVND